MPCSFHGGRRGAVAGAGGGGGVEGEAAEGEQRQRWGDQGCILVVRRGVCGYCCFGNIFFYLAPLKYTFSIVLSERKRGLWLWFLRSISSLSFLFQNKGHIARGVKFVNILFRKYYFLLWHRNSVFTVLS